MNLNGKLLCGAAAIAALSIFAARPARAVVNNIALGKPATQSSTGFGGVASRGVDGNNATWTHSETQFPADPMMPHFWQVDLTGPNDLVSIELVNRVDACCGSRLNGAVLKVLDDSMATIFTSPAISNAAAGQAFTFDNGGLGFSGAQFIRVEQSLDWLSIGELRAFQEVVPQPYDNLAYFFGTATQSSMYPGLPASNAIDGARAGNSISHTFDNDFTPSLSVDLGNLYRLETIDVYTRDNCCTATDPERDYNLTVEVLDGQGNVVYTHPVYNPWDGVDPPDGAPVVGLGASFSIDLPGGGVIGQTVRVSKIAHGGLQHSEWLSIAELEVYGSTTAVPEPSSMALVAIGVAGGLFVVRRRK